MKTPELVLLGGPNSGKTHYAGQLYGRLRRRPGVLKLRQDQGTPADLSALEEVLRCLEEGNAAGHTPTETWSEVLFPLIDNQGNSLDLRWPDYGGEQLNTVFSQREVSDQWRSKLINADGWVLLIRLKSETTYPDALTELTKRSNKQDTPSSRLDTWDANAKWVELLQILLHVAGLASTKRLTRPRLAILLSCYDEIESNNPTPRDALAEHLPLLSSFIESNWDSEAVNVWGLSALGRPLDTSSSDDNFIDDGPECQGWVISPEGGDQDSDLSKPLAWLLGAQ